VSVSYWSMIAENVAKGLGPKTLQRLNAGGRVLGRVGAVAGIGFMAFELFKSYKDNIEAEPAYQEMIILQEELEKWGSAISSLGRQPYTDKPYGDHDEGGAINALYPKRALGGAGILPPEPETAIELIQRARGYIQQTENLSEDSAFDEKRDDLSHTLTRLNQDIENAADYSSIQKKLAAVVDEIRPIEKSYAARIYECSREIQKNIGSNAAWAAISMATLGLIRKKKAGD